MSGVDKPGYFPHIGMRKIKSILAMFAGFWLWQAVRLVFPELEVHPIYMYIYGIIEMRDSSEKTIDFGTRRIKATFTALVVGLPVLALSEFLKSCFWAEWQHIALELALVLIGTIVTIGAAEKVGCKTFCGLAAAIFVVLFISHADDERYIYAVLRAVQTVAAVFVAWLINVKLFPYPKKTKEEQKNEPCDSAEINSSLLK